MAGYRCVNFYDLCRLCSSVKDEKNVQIFTTDGLLKKINDCLPITLSEKDKLPKIICSSCHEYIEIFSEFRKSCSNAQKMLEGCLNSTKLRNGGQVYIKDEVPVKKVLKPIQNSSPNKILSSINIVASSPNKSIKKNVITPNQPDFLSSIMQAVGIQTGEEGSENITLTQPNLQQNPSVQSLPQYTLTLDGNTIKSGQIQYKIENAGNLLGQSPIITAKNLQDIQGQQMTLNQVDEFLKLKQKPSIIVKKDSVNPTLTLSTNTVEEPRDKKPKFNLILQASPQKSAPKGQQPQILSATPSKASFTSPNKPQILNIEKILPVMNQSSPTKQVVVPIMVRNDGSRNTIASGDAAAQIISQAFSLSSNQTENNAKIQQKPIAYMQMKLQSNADGQLTFTPATTNPQPLQLSLSPQQLQQLSFQATQNLTVPQISIPTATQQVSQDIQTQTQETSDKHDSADDEMYNESFDNDYYPVDENESHLSNSQEKASSQVVKKTIKKSVKTLKPVKSKNKTDTSTNSEPPINPEHSEMAKKQLNQLTSFNSKRTEGENSDKNSEINLTVCNVCEKRFKRKEFLMQHLKSHIGLRPFKCDDPSCNKSFSRKEHLLRHISSHTGKKEFTCNICNKLFSRKDNLNKHKRIHPDAGQANSRHKTQIIKNDSSCNEKGNSSDHPKEIKEIKAIVKKIKEKTEKKDEVKTVATQNTITQQQQQPKLVQVLQTTTAQQMGLKDSQQQIILSMSQAQAMLSSQQSKAIYTISPNIILNQHGTFVAATANSDLVGNLKFENQ